jgi:hypothetical protein
MMATWALMMASQNRETQGGNVMSMIQEERLKTFGFRFTTKFAKTLYKLKTEQGVISVQAEEILQHNLNIVEDNCMFGLKPSVGGTKEEVENYYSASLEELKRLYYDMKENKDIILKKNKSTRLYEKL